MKNMKTTENKIKSTTTLSILSAAGLALAVSFTPNLRAGECSASKQTTATSQAASPDLVGLAAGAGNFKTLVAAVKAAGLVEVLQSPGPFTVFAPTDEAFAKLPAGTVETLLQPQNRDKLASILKYHVVPGKVMAADVRTMKVKSALGQTLNLKVSDAGVRVNEAKVIKTDLAAKNGVIHVIDTVILPKS